jgi:lactoylglutathione lyase
MAWATAAWATSRKPRNASPPSTKAREHWSGVVVTDPGIDPGSPYASAGNSRLSMPDAKRARAVGFNHIALEVGDIDEALSFYGRIFAFELRGKSEDMAFIDLGDQFLALQKGRRQSPDDGRHFGLWSTTRRPFARHWPRRRRSAAGPFLDFRDPWGNSRSSATTTSSSLRRRMFCAAWG